MSNQITERVESVPIYVLPGVLQNIINKYDDVLNFSPHYTLQAILFASSVAIGNSYKVQLQKGHVQSAALYLCAIGKAGVGKTHPFTTLLKPLFELDKRYYTNYQAELSKWRALPPPLRKITDPPELHKTIVSDITKAGLIDRHKTNLRGVGVFVDEMNGFFKSIQTGTNKETFLSAWSGAPLNKDVKNESVIINDPFISIAGTIQPEIFIQSVGQDILSSGFLDRILFSYPEIQQKDKWSIDKTVPEYVEKHWSIIINNLLANQYDSLSKIFTFCKESGRYIVDWQHKNADRCNKDAFYAGIGSKIETYALRFSLIMQSIHNAWTKEKNPEIGLEWTKAGIELANYFAHQAVQIRETLLKNNSVGLADWRLKFFDSLPSIVSFTIAKEIGTDLGLNDKAVQRFLTESGRFHKLKHGVYEKL